MGFIVVAFYTENTMYEQEVQHLISSLNKFKLEMDIVAIPTQGSWQENTQFKAYFIKQMLIKHFPKSVLYLDADARVQQYPALFDAVDFDVGVAYRENVELLSSTMFFSNNGKVFELIERWIRGCISNPTVWDQQVFQYLLHEKSQDLRLKIRRLPPTYCQIFDLMKHEGEAVIEQFQASRRSRASERQEP